MSGDVQPRKRKDKKKKKDELGLEEPRGTAAALGEGDVFMHSYSDHGTGGHWCAKVIFFSLLAILVSLIGLIILENRGLSELEANSVESRYSNILEGWLEDAPDDDHHDEHTLELKHHDDDEDDHYASHDTGEHDEHDDEEHADEDDNEDEDEHGDEDEDKDDDDPGEDEDREDDDNASEDEEEDYENEDENALEDSQQDLDEADDEDEDDRSPYKYYAQEDEDDEDEYDQKNVDDEEDEQETADDDEEQNKIDSNEEFGNEDEYDDDRNVEGDEDEEANDNDDDDDDEEEDNLTREDEEDHDDHEEDDDEVEVERIEREASEEDPISAGPVLSEEDDDERDNKDDDDDQDDENEEDDDGDDDDDAANDDFLEAEEPIAERVTVPAGKPFVEVDDDDVSTETPPDTLKEEEEYEKQQEELRKEEEQSTHHIWLKLTVGAALLVATQAVLRRATAPREEGEEEREDREITPAVDRRMTLIPEEAPKPVVTKKEIAKPVVEEIVRREAPFVKAPVIQQESEEEEIEEQDIEEIDEEELEEEPEKLEVPKKEDKELYSDEEEDDVKVKKEAPKPAEEPEPDEDPDDVEIIDEEQLDEEELEEEDEVSDVDDAELLSRLEAKYGRLPEPERFGPKQKDGGNSVGDDSWPGEPSDAYWRQQLDSAERELRQGAWSSAATVAGSRELAGSGRARWLAAAALDKGAEARRDNEMLSRAIAAYLRVLEMSDRLSDERLLEVARRTLDRIQFRGNYLKAEPVYRLLIRRFPNEPAYRNNMTIAYLMANRNDLAENVLKETLASWPDDRVALAHYGFILKTNHKDKLEEAVELFRRALEDDTGPACEPRFYYHYGDALLLLNRYEEAHEVHKRGARLGHFLSPAQRSLYNVARLKSQPWWDVAKTPYAALAKTLEGSWREILKEGEKAAALYKEEEEGLRERGQWSQLDLFSRGVEVGGRCLNAPVTCGAIRAAGDPCRRGQVKFSLMAPGTHVRPHVGPTNCRLRMHLGLSNTRNTYLRVDKETRQWKEGKVLLFDDSFEHEVWHNGTGPRLVLIVDVWHPDLTQRERRALPAI